MAYTITVTLKDKDGGQVSVHTLSVESVIPEVFISEGSPYILRRVLPGKRDAIATAPSSSYNFDEAQPTIMMGKAMSWTVMDTSERHETPADGTEPN